MRAREHVTMLSCAHVIDDVRLIQGPLNVFWDKDFIGKSWIRVHLNVYDDVRLAFVVFLRYLLFYMLRKNSYVRFGLGRRLTNYDPTLFSRLTSETNTASEIHPRVRRCCTKDGQYNPPITESPVYSHVQLSMLRYDAVKHISGC